MKLIPGIWWWTAAGIFTVGMALVQAGAKAKAAESDKSKTPENLQTAVFAGGCFWCMEADFEKVEGVVRVVSDYTGGRGENPTYNDYARKGHVEAVQVFFDPAKVSYERLLDVFWRSIDPTDPGGQFVDRGAHYRSAIFYLNEEQKRLAEESKKKLAASGRFSKPIVTEILPFTRFYPAEDYHQDYYRNHPLRYQYYRRGSGRDQFLRKVWGEEPRWGPPRAEIPGTRNPLTLSCAKG